MTVNEHPLLIGFVGPCGAGKTTITSRLDSLGYQTRHIAQEHSYVKDMWQRLSNPDLLIFLQASYEVTVERRDLNWTEADYAEQQRRLSHARQHADLYIETDNLSIEQVVQQVLKIVSSRETQSPPE